MTFADIILKGCSTWNIEIDDEVAANLEKYAELLIEKNKVMNLTAITQMDEVATRHMLDCIYQLKCADFAGKRVIDIGSGGGFPGIPLQICCPTSEFLLVDSRKKRVDFLEEVCQELGLAAKTRAGRAEELVAEKNMREAFDIAVSRAVAPLNVLCEICLPFVRVGGVFLAMKSDNENASVEIVSAQRAVRVLGATLESCEKYTLPETDVAHQIVVIKKTSATPAKYPRRFAKIEAEPI